MTLAANIAARDALTRAITGERPPLQLSAVEAEEALFGHHYKGPGMPTIEDVREAFSKVRIVFGEPEALALLQRFAAKSLKDVWLGSYKDLIEFAKACVSYGVPPSASWTDGKPTHLEEL